MLYPFEYTYLKKKMLSVYNNSEVTTRKERFSLLIKTANTCNTRTTGCNRTETENSIDKLIYFVI